MIFIADLIACSTCFWNHYAHHQELESIIQVVAVCGIWCFCFQVVGMLWNWGLCVRFAGCCCSSPQTGHITLMGIMVPEMCWASNKICNKNHLLRVVGILFPHINDDARSKSHQILSVSYIQINKVVENICFYNSGLNYAFAIRFSTRLGPQSWVSNCTPCGLTLC
jgi:hypothetical protein